MSLSASLSVRRAVLAVAVTCMAFALQAGSASADVAVCTPTDYSQDGNLLTARYINPATVPENAEASDSLGNQCDIGIYYNDGAAHALTSTHVFGARYYGILVRGAGTTLTFSRGSVYDTGDNPQKDGAQHGIDVAFRDGGAGQVDHSQIYDYQKGGVLVTDAGSNAQVLSNTVRGLGPVPFIAQNGVQYSNGATGAVNDNFIEDNEYTGCSKQDQRAGKCTYVVSTGILLANVDPTLVDTRNNTYRNNDVNLYNGANSSP